MTIIRVKGFKIFEGRHRNGVVYCYHRRTRTAVDLSKAPLGSAAFFAECARITELLKVSAPSKPATLGGAIERYKAHPAFNDLASKTRHDYQRIFDYLRPIADTPLSRFDPPLVVGIRDKAGERGRRSGNYVKAVLSVVFAWAVERGLMESNPAVRVKNVRRPRNQPDANRPWTDAERHAVVDQAPPQMLPALALMIFTGLGPGDALRLPRTFYREGAVATRRSKTGEPVYWPAPAPLREILDAAPKHDAITLCANSNGKPWTESGFRASWRTYRAKLRSAGAIGPGLTLYGARHSVAVILRECGFDERTIADALGQKTIEMARHYAKGADLTTKMIGVAETFEREVNRRRTKVSNLPEKVSNRDAAENRREQKS